jgi:hypothetical protein
MTKGSLNYEELLSGPWRRTKLRLEIIQETRKQGAGTGPGNDPAGEEESPENLKRG